VVGQCVWHACHAYRAYHKEPVRGQAHRAAASGGGGSGGGGGGGGAVGALLYCCCWLLLLLLLQRPVSGVECVCVCVWYVHACVHVGVAGVRFRSPRSRTKKGGGERGEGGGWKDGKGEQTWQYPSGSPLAT